jgi:hypothetical protein
MKSKSLFFLPAAILLVLIYGFGGDAKYPGGSPGGYTGSPGDGKNCTQCHGGSASAVVGWISSNIPDGGYIPGETYTINISITGSGDKGFEVSPQDLSGNLLGTLTAGTGNHLVAGTSAVTQNNSTSANPAQWQFEWTAPEAGTGDVTFYGAFTVNKPVTKLSSYTTNENTGVSIKEEAGRMAEVYPNPALDNINISYEASAKGSLSVSLVSMDGRSFPLMDMEILREGLHSFHCALPSDLPSGLYILNLHDSSRFSNIKLFIR